MKYTKIEGMLIKAPIKMKKNRKGETVCKLIVFDEYEELDKPLKAEGITANEALLELGAGDTIEAICHETNRHFIIDLIMRKSKFKKGA